MELYLYIKRCGHYMEHLWNWWCVTRSSKSHKECHVFAFLALLKGIEEIKIPIYCTRVLHSLSATIQYAINPKKERPGDLWYTNINLKHMVAHTHTHYSPPHSISHTHADTYMHIHNLTSSGPARDLIWRAILPSAYIWLLILLNQYRTMPFISLSHSLSRSADWFPGL